MENMLSDQSSVGYNLKQCFYIIEPGQDSEEIYKDIVTLYDLSIPVVIVIDPNDKIHNNVIKILETLQVDKQINLLLKKTDMIDKSYFLLNEYNKRLTISGGYYQTDSQAVYIGEDEIAFNIVDIGQPLDTLSQINIKKDTKDNIGLVITRNNYNISALLLAFNELEGENLHLGSYQEEFEQANMLCRAIASIGDITLIFFSISIIVFLAAIIIFKRWSKERFID
ncbi:MAG: hypothetical protein GX366_04420 [Epulopiscium sp.]|nr:hypothetical protein [Candidatus Epulonipiscium sp.]